MNRRAARSRSVRSSTRLRVRRPADFLAVIPYLLGFHPERSVVAVLFREGRVLLTARFDLPPPSVAGGLAQHLSAVARLHHVEQVVLVAYADEPAAGRLVLQQLLADPPVPVRDGLVVAAARWWSLTCTAGCCPGEGTPYDPAGHPLAAEAVYAGLSAEQGRTSLAALVAGPDEATAVRLREPLARARRRVERLATPAAARLMAATVRHCRAGAGAASPEDCLLLAVLAADLVVRDVAWALMSRSDSEDDVRLWSRVVSQAPPEVAPGAIGLLGAAAWIAGQGALQNCCVERLERLDPGYTLGSLLADISDRALAPSAWDEMAEDLRREVCAVAGLPGLH